MQRDAVEDARTVEGVEWAPETARELADRRQLTVTLTTARHRFTTVHIATALRGVHWRRSCHKALLRVLITAKQCPQTS